MERFGKHVGEVLHLPWDNIDTDQIIPARYLHRPRDAGYADQLFHDLRFDAEGAERAEFPLNAPENRNATVLIAGQNFGCGSSREHAVWALMDFGFQVVIAPGFGDIFFNNSLKNGLLAIPLSAGEIETLAQPLSPGSTVTVDLEAQTVIGADGRVIRFEIDPYRKEALLLGASEIAMTLREQESIERFEARHLETHPWIIPSRGEQRRV
jgi:3-isopropylmalate/(R)-2-methylmalate dehydratase small subunit